MSSTLLYLAIVAVWAGVLVPMWLRREADAPGFTRLLHRRSGTPDDPAADEPAADEPHDPTAYDEDPVIEERQPRRRNGRAAVIARRRRRTSGLVLLVLVMAGIVIAGLAPWWAALPPIGLLGGHLSLLRVAAGMDAARRREAALARLEARALERERRLAEEAREAEEADRAEVIDLTARSRAGEVFDQYTDQLRAVGD
ncbi:divisome protein SepX/GlpR [Actinomadura scrupuli]|uniref:divisome protein SepX/GlpR n=1 Tax=Actinomadura scrupuli TaxID=559629 RepID=UPI003D982551